MEEIEPTFLADIQHELAGLHLVSMSLDAYGQVLILGVSHFDYVERRDEHSPQFPKLKTNKPHDFVVLEIGSQHVRQFRIANQYWNFHHVQPLPNDELLLICSRSRYRAQGDYDLNGCVFSADGVLQREFLLGDSIADVQTTRSGMIWTSYFDEGIFGNTGFRNLVGIPGLIQWDRFGNRRFNYVSTSGLDSIDDCYALNVDSEQDVWIYYYSQFPLVHLKNNQVQEYWLSSVRSASNFAVWRDRVLFSRSHKNIIMLHLLRLLEKNEMETIATYSISADIRAITARGSRILLLQDSSLFYVDVRDLVK